jgi:hypothetical protein
LPPVVPQPVVSVSYNGQSEYTNKFSAAPIQTQPIQRTEQIQQQNSRQNFQQVSSRSARFKAYKVLFSVERQERAFRVDIKSISLIKTDSTLKGLKSIVEN